MRYISIDLETTGLDPRKHQVIEIAMVHEDTENPRALVDLPKLRLLIARQDIRGQPEALEMNRALLAEAREVGFTEEQAWQLVKEQLNDWGYWSDRKAVAAGKNVAGFDLQFFPDEIREMFHHRVIDPGSVFFDFKSDRPPSLGTILGRPVSHTALEDARDVVEVLRKKYT